MCCSTKYSYFQYTYFSAIIQFAIIPLSPLSLTTLEWISLSLYLFLALSGRHQAEQMISPGAAHESVRGVNEPN